MGSSFRLGLLTAAGLALLALPAAAQFNPPRPPGAVPNRGPAPPPPQAMPPDPPPLNMQAALPPDETDDDAVAAQPPPPPVRGGQAATRGGPPPVQMPGAPAIIRGQQLAPPPG